MSTAGGLGSLRDLSRRAVVTARVAGGQICEMCSEPIRSEHGHVADLQDLRLLCSCRACYLLFTGHGAGGGRYRALPEHSRRVTGVVMSQQQWDALQIPVDLAFLFRQHGSPTFTACYPGPAGATQSLLDLASWGAVLQANPVLDTVEQDVEAVLLRRTGGRVDCYLVPIDRCYELVGLVRTHWVGLAGGPQVWSAIDAFFEDLVRRSAGVGRGGAGRA